MKVHMGGFSKDPSESFSRVFSEVHLLVLCKGSVGFLTKFPGAS